MSDAPKDRAQMLRGEAARCLALAQEAWSPHVRRELMEMASRLTELANGTAAYDFDAMLRTINDDTIAQQPVTQQQQQVQPKKE
jgi:hypothetical protein